MTPRPPRAMGVLTASAVLLLLCASGVHAIVPDQVVSFMHILYSSLPVIRKGTDSRVGLGFRFGPLADGQVVLELGPQAATEPLARPPYGASSPSSATGKRHSGDGLLLHGGAPSLPDLDDNHLDVRHRGRAFQVREGRKADADAAASGSEWLSRWRAGWPPSPAAPSASAHRHHAARVLSSATPAAAPRPGRELRIALAQVQRPAVATPTPTPKTTTMSASLRPSSTSSTAPSATTSSSSSTLRTSSSAPALHLRDAMTLLSAKAASAAPSPRLQPPLFQGGILRALRRLWRAGVRAANGGHIT